MLRAIMDHWLDLPAELLFHSVFVQLDGVSGALEIDDSTYGEGCLSSGSIAGHLSHSECMKDW